MIQLFNKKRIKVAVLRDHTDLKIESLLESGDKTLSFSYPKNSKYYDEILEEAYIRTKSNEFVIKARNSNEFTCKLNVEDLEGKTFDRFVSIEQTILNALNLALVGTGWKVGKCSLKKKRTVRKTNCSSWEIIQEIKKTYRVDIVFNTLVKEIEVYEHLGEDRGTYFIESLNLKDIDIQSNSYDYATRIIPVGKDGLNIKSINGGKDYVENYQYSNKIKTVYWKDERYTVIESLKADAEAKLNEISKPYRSYSANIINLTKIDNQYKNITDYKLGDTITLISKDNKVKEKQRIVKIIEYPDDHSKDTIELANSILRFEDIQKEFQETTDTVDNITTDDGTIDGSTVDSIQTQQIEDFKANVIQVTNLKAVNADIEHLKVNKVDAQDLNAVKGRIGTLEATTINTTQFKALEGQIDFFKSNYSKIHDLEVTNEKVKIIEGKVSNFDEVLAGNITSKNIATNTITANSGIIADGAIGSAQISSLDLNKLNAGDIDTSKINLIGPLRRLKIVGDKIQILDNKDGKLYERIMLGVDDNNNSTLILRGADGKTILLNQDGLTNAGFTEGYGRVKDNTLSASKFEKNSIVRQINDATETIKSTKVKIGDRTLDIELSTQNNIVNEHSKDLFNQKTSINALDNAIKLKVDNQVFKKSNIDTNEKIDNIHKQITDTSTNLHKVTSKLDVLQDKINTKVSQIDIDKSIKEMKIGGRNLILDSNNFKFQGSDYIKNVDYSNDNEIIIKNKNINFNVWSFIQSSITKNLDCSKFYCLSLDIKTNEDIENTTLNFEYQKSYINYKTKIKNTNGKWQRFSVLIKPCSADTSQIVICIGSEGKSSNATKIEYRNIKLEEGNIVTDFTEAPEDTRQLIVDSQKSTIEKIDNVSSELNQAKNSFNLSVNDLHSKTKTLETNISNVNKDLSTQIKTIKTDINNTTSQVNILKKEISTKINKTDIDKTVKDINNKMKSSDEKINQASSEFKQTTDNLKANIEKVTSTTKTIENNLNNKANKSEVSQVSSQFTTIKADLNNVTQKISHTESNVNKINKDITTFNNKINSVEQKITPNSITNTVLNSYQYQENIKNKVSYENFTSYKQSSEEFSLKVKQGFGYNLIKNSGFENGLNFWSNNGGAELLVDQKWQVKFGEKTLLIKGKGKGSGIYQKFKCEKGKVYNVVFSAYPDGDNGIATSIGIEGLKTINIIALKYWCEHSFTFTATENEHTFIAYTEGIGNFYIDNIQVCEGSIIQPWSPHPSEIYGSVIKIDSEELKASYSDGSYSLMGRQGFEHWHNGMSHPYHYLFHRGSIDKVNSQQTVRVYVPEEFKGKHYGISWWDGNKFPQYEGDLLFSPNVELVNRNDEEGWFDLKANLMVRNPDRGESAPAWRGKMNIIYTLIA